MTHYEQLVRAVKRLSTDEDFQVVAEYLRSRLAERKDDLVMTNDDDNLLRVQGAARELVDIVNTLAPGQ
ncbi:MAG: hypothetical protein WDA07_06490 [Leucobacter sp.]